MSFRISALLLVFCSLSAAALALIPIRRFASPQAGPSYAALSVDAAWPDRLVGERLAGVGDYISESTQWVFLDDFGELLRIPLDQYRERVESFDLRDDGYAGLLSSFFVQEGRRRFFIPLAAFPSSGELERLEASLAAALGDIPFSLKVWGRGRPVLWYLILFTGAAAAALILSPSATALFPLMAAAALAGPAGFALSAVLSALTVLLRRPLGEFFTARRYGSPRLRGKTGGAVFSRFPGIPVLLVLLLYGAVCTLGELHPIPALSLPFLFLSVSAATFWTWSNRGRGAAHIRFMPVPIVDAPVPFPRHILPFALAAALALVPPPVFSGLPLPGEREGEGGLLIRAEDYERHAAFQAAFSRSPLSPRGGADPLNQSAYLRYYLGVDGLIAGEEEVFSGDGSPDIPPFPLGPLTDFLAGTGGQGDSGIRFPPFREALPAGLAFFAGLPVLFRAGRVRRKKMRTPMTNEKRIAA